MAKDKKVKGNLFGDNTKISEKKSVKSNPNNWIWWAIAVFVIVFLAFYWFFAGFGKVEYKGLAFDMQKYGNDLILYHHSYLLTFNKQTYNVNLYLRVDPRKNDVPVDGSILFTKGREVYLGINNTGIISCEDSSIATGTLAQFFANNQFSLSRGTNDYNESIEKRQKYITCDKWPDNTVVILQSGNETRIDKINDGCFVISVNNCEIEPAVEKFIVNALIDTKEQRELAAKK